MSFSPRTFRRAALVAALLLVTASSARGQGLTVTRLESDAALTALLPAPSVRVQARAGNRVLGGDHELALRAPAAGSALLAQRAWNGSQNVPFRVTYDGFGHVTLDLGGQMLSHDVQGGFTSLAVRAASSSRGAGVLAQGLSLNNAWIGVSPRARSFAGESDVEAVLIQGTSLGSGFVLRGFMRFSWIQPLPTGDELQLEVCLGVPAQLGRTYCVATPNSTGAACRIDWSGAPSLSTAGLWLHATGGVPSSPCMFLTSRAAQALPFGNGWLCVGPPIERLGDLLTLDASGAVSLAVPPDAAPLAGMLAGEVRTFQLWYRDPAGLPEPYNLSDALALTFVP